MSLLRRFLDFTTDPNVVSNFQKACGIVYCPDSSPSKQQHFRNGDIDLHRQNGISPETGRSLNGTITRKNGIHSDPGNNNSSDVDKNLEESSPVKHRNGLLKSDDCHSDRNLKDAKHQENGVIRTGTIPYRIENKLLFYLFSFGAQLGNAVFYVAFYSFSFWNFDSLVTRKICLVWCICMYFGQAAKDIIRLPRPRSPPVVRLETRYELEYGMPSTHACVGTAIPLCMLIFTAGRYEYPLVIGGIIATAWCILVCLSRIYLGMHTILDVLAGVLFAIVVMTITVPYVDPLHDFLVMHTMAPVVLLSAPVVLTLVYPSVEKWSTCRGDTTLILALSVGMYGGAWFNYYQGYITPVDSTPPFTLDITATTAVHGALRLLFGVTLIVATLLVSKPITYKTSCYVLNKDARDPLTRQLMAVEIPYKYIPYFLTAFNSVYTAPIMFHYMGISRASYYTEI